MTKYLVYANSPWLAISIRLRSEETAEALSGVHEVGHQGDDDDSQLQAPGRHPQAATGQPAFTR